MIKLYMFAIIAIAISGCAIWGPNYVKPDIDHPDNWQSINNSYNISAESAINMPDMAWWKSFNDQALNEMIMIALKNNANIEQAVGNITQAAGLLQQVKMSWVPIVGAQVVNNGSSSSSSGIVTHNSMSSIGYAAGLIPTYSLNILQQLRSQEAATATLAASKLAKDAVRLTVISQVVGSYFSLRSFDYQLKQQIQLSTDLSKLYDIAKLQYLNGYISLLSLQSYEQQLSQSNVQIPIIENNITQTQNALRLLLNQNPGDIKRGLDIMQFDLNNKIPVNLPSVVLRQRPDIIQAEELLKVANADIGVATTNFFPSIMLTAAEGVGSSSLLGLFTGSDFWASQIIATMPILNLSIYGEIETAKGAYYSAYYNYIYTVKNAFAQVENGLVQNQKLNQSYHYQLDYYKSSELSYNLTNSRYKEGADSLANLLTSKASLDNSAITLNQAKLQQLQSIVNLYQVLAGGYNIDNTEKQKPFNDGHDL